LLTRLRIQNFKRFGDVDLELGGAVVLIGANNSGKTTALQALALWNIGVRRWVEKRKGRESPEKRPGVTINRRDLIALPVPNANLLWRDLHVRDVKQVDVVENGRHVKKPKTSNIRINVIVDGVTQGRTWSCGLEFDYANEESFYCRPLRTNGGAQPERMPFPFEEAGAVRVAFLPPMSGLAAVEPVWEPGRVNVLIGEGQTAQVLRNLCSQLYEKNREAWERLVGHISGLFGAQLQPPNYLAERGEITMAYREASAPLLDLSSSGRGLQQTLLLLAHLYANPGCVLLLDEPDAHLEILRQRQIYRLITEVAGEQGSQLIAASHSEVVLNEAAGRDIVIAFVGRPHRIDDRGAQVQKALREIGFEHYLQAEQTGWVLYLEGSTDLAILRAFARTLRHAAEGHLERPFVHYVGREPSLVQRHFFGLREASPDLVGCALFDRLERELPDDPEPVYLMWGKREIESYLCARQVLLAYARHEQPDDLFGAAEAERRVRAMQRAIDKVAEALRTLSSGDPWGPDVKATDEFLDPVPRHYFEDLKLPNLMRKSDYHELARLVPRDEIDPEVIEKLDAIARVAASARPRLPE